MNNQHPPPQRAAVKLTNVDRSAAIKRLRSTAVKDQICNTSANSLITKTIARLKTGHHRGMEFDRDGRRTYKKCDNCLEIELIPAHIFDCPAILAALHRNLSTNLCVGNIEQIARAVIWVHGYCLVWSCHGYGIISIFKIFTQEH
ncbi:uncharacterized protein TNCV_2243871 [Trichonephila clavipes]|nr:uncharacterized protein TNCV_2243871 [Trichonephila clavipes]